MENFAHVAEVGGCFLRHSSDEVLEQSVDFIGGVVSDFGVFHVAQHHGNGEHQVAHWLDQDHLLVHGLFVALFVVDDAKAVDLSAFFEVFE